MIEFMRLRVSTTLAGFPSLAILLSRSVTRRSLAVDVPKVLVQINDDAQTDDGVLLVLELQLSHRELEQLRHPFRQLLRVRYPIEDLENDVA